MVPVCLEVEICPWLRRIISRFIALGRTASVPARLPVVGRTLGFGCQPLAEAGWWRSLINAGLALACQRVALASIA